MKAILTTLAILLIGLSARTASAQGGTNYATITNVLDSLGVPYEYRSTLNLGNGIDTLSQNAADPNPQYIVFNKGVGAKGNVKLRANYIYYQQFNTNAVNIAVVGGLGDPSGQGLYGTNGAQVILDVTKNAQILTDGSLIKLFATSGRTYVLSITNSSDGSNYYLTLRPAVSR